MKFVLYCMLYQHDFSAVKQAHLYHFIVFFVHFECFKQLYDFASRSISFFQTCLVVITSNYFNEIK